MSKTSDSSDNGATQAPFHNPKAYAKPWSVTLKQRMVVDTDLIDEIRLENEKFEEFVDRTSAALLEVRRQVRDQKLSKGEAEDDRATSRSQQRRLANVPH